MALVHTGSIVSDIRGSVGTETYARNQGGLFVRTRKGPTDNTGANRVDCRNKFKALSRLWSSTLTPDQRTNWRAYAHENPDRDTWGVPNLTNGYARFLRTNWYRYRDTAALGYRDAPPSPPIHPPVYVFSADVATNQITFAIPPVNYDPPPADLDLYAYVGYQQNLGVAFAPNTWRKLSVNHWNAAAWSTDPWTVAYPDQLETSKKLWTRIIAQLHDTGELSRYFQISAETEAPPP